MGRAGSAAGLRAVVADSNVLARRGLVSILTEAGAQVVGEAEDTQAALRWVAQSIPDVLLVSADLRAPERGHVVAIARDRWSGSGQSASTLARGTASAARSDASTLPRAWRSLPS